MTSPRRADAGTSLAVMNGSEWAPETPGAIVRRAGVRDTGERESVVYDVMGWEFSWLHVANLALGIATLTAVIALAVATAVELLRRMFLQRP